MQRIFSLELNPTLDAPCVNILGSNIFLWQEPGTLHGNSPKTNKLAKDKANLKATTPFSRNRKSALTQSLSFPARGGASNVYPVKREAKHAQRHVTSSLNHPISSASMPIIRRTVVVSFFFVFSFLSVWSFQFMPYLMLK